MFLFVAMQAPHSPLEVPDTYLTQYSDIEDKKRRVFAAMTTCMDEAIGNITHALDRHDMRSNTVVIFSSGKRGYTEYIADPQNAERGQFDALLDDGMEKLKFAPVFFPQRSI